MKVPGATFAPVPYDGALSLRAVDSINLIVIHCTELPDMHMARDYAERIHYPGTNTGNCGHLYVDRNGDVYQYASLDRVAHHVRSYNRESIGIELVNNGRYPHWFHSKSQTPTDPYPDAQIESLTRLVGQLIRLLPGLGTIAGHDELDLERVNASDNPRIQVRRKIDPGPLFPWPSIMEQLPHLSRWKSEPR